FIEDKDNFNRGRAAFELGFKAIAEEFFVFTIFLSDANRLQFMREELFDYRDKFRGFHVLPGFGLRMSNANRAVRFNFSGEKEPPRGNKLDNFFCGILGIKDDMREGNLFLIASRARSLARAILLLKVFGSD
ncbi:MAG: hypothetical protein ACE5DO_10525, partial [Desulfobacterales bacterium]